MFGIFIVTLAPDILRGLLNDGMRSTEETVKILMTKGLQKRPSYLHL